MPTAKSQSVESVRQTLRDAIKEALKIFTPPERITVSEWADRYRSLSKEETSRPGMWDTSSVPYMKKIMDCFSEETIREIVFLKSTQIGGSEALINMLGYIIDQQPSRIYYVLPDDDLCIKFSENRLKRMFLSNREVFKGKVDLKSDAKFIKFNGGFAAIASARSPSELASWSVPVVLLDEIDKYPIWSGREANPIKLAEERTKNWPIAKVVKISTPTLKTGAIYKAYEAADIRYRFEMPCPHCGKSIAFQFANIKWPRNQFGEADPTVVQYQSYYECEYCKGRIDDRQKMQMMRAGEWKPLNQRRGRPRSVAFQINSIYSPWLTFGMVAVEFLTSKDDPETLMNFVNSWLGEPWEDKAATMDSEAVQNRRSDIPMGIIPSWAQIITAGVDVQKRGFYWTIRAWGYRMTSQNIAHGWAESFEEIEAIMNKVWPDEDGDVKWQVNLCAIDSGYSTEDVYDFCLQNSDWCVPVKGAVTQKVGRFTRSAIDAIGKQYHGQALYIVNGDSYKDLIAARLRRPLGRGCWMAYAESDLEYAEQVTAEHKIATVKGGRRMESWVPKTSHAQNHYLDAEVYAACAADLLQVRYLDEKDSGAVDGGVEGRQGQQEADEFITEKGDGWLS